MTRDELIPDAEGDRGRPKGPQGIDRDALIEKARASGFCDQSHAVADFCLPFIAQAREEAIKEAQAVLRKAYTDGGWTLSELIERIRALRGEKGKA